MKKKHRGLKEIKIRTFSNLPREHFMNEKYIVKKELIFYLISKVICLHINNIMPRIVVACRRSAWACRTIHPSHDPCHLHYLPRVE